MLQKLFRPKVTVGLNIIEKETVDEIYVQDSGNNSEIISKQYLHFFDFCCTKKGHLPVATSAAKYYQMQRQTHEGIIIVPLLSRHVLELPTLP